MTGIVVRTARESKGLGPRSPWLDSALSSETMEITQRIQALQNSPSPATVPVSGDRFLQERLFDALAAVKIMTSQVAMHMDGEWRGRLFRQLDSLHDPAEWEEGDQPVQQSSFSTFLKAMLSIKPKRRPGLGLSHAGHLIAAWTTGRDRLTIEFLPNDHIRWVLSRHYDGDTERFAGDTRVDRLAEGLASYHPEHWFEYVEKNH
jgi:hypothetical protein